MDADEARIAVDRVLTADLDVVIDALTADGESSLLPPLTALEWRIPASDRAVLSRFGLPRAPELDPYQRIGGWYQEGEEPEYPGWERGGPGYYLAFCADVRIVARENDGAVIAVPNVRETVPGLPGPGAVDDEVINSTVEHFVDFAWRWHAIAPVLVELHDAVAAADEQAWRDRRRGGGSSSAAGPEPSAQDLWAPYRDLCGRVREHFRAHDPMAVAGEDAMWSLMIGGFE